jgi:hypothetical protein
MARISHKRALMSMSIAECRAAGVVFEADEAVAIAQQLMTSLRDPQNTDEVERPFGPPSASNVFLNEDGSVICRGCQMTPAVSEIAIFLENLLPEGSTRVPGGLRYAMARALLNVDVPPFDSLDDFSRDLARHERGSRPALVQRVLARTTSHHIVPARLVDRRRSQISATALRRELREADVRLYQRREAVKSAPASIDMATVSSVPQRGRTLTAAAACAAAGLVLVGAGELMHKDRAPVAAVPATTTQTPAVVEPDLRVAQSSTPTVPSVGSEQRAPAPDRGIIVVRDTAPKPVRASRPEVRRVSLKRPSSSSTNATVRRATQRQSPRKDMWDRLKLGWLRNAFSSRSSL